MRTIEEILSSGDYISGEAISRELGITRAAVWKRIEALRADGWEIESAGKRGYRLIAGDGLHSALWQGGLRTQTLGRGEVRCLQSVDSTNSEVKRMAAQGAPSGSLCVCEEQTAGRGRLGRTWVSPPGVGLWQSLLLRPQLSPEQAPLITLAAAMAMAQAVRETSGADVGIKWPNDLVCGGKKICGILLEMSADPDTIEYVVVGIGLNVLRGSIPPGLEAQAACVEDIGQRLPKRREILCAYLEAMERLMQRLEAGGWPAIAEDYRAMSLTLGQAVQVIGAQSFTGTAEDIDGRGALVVRDSATGERRTVYSGDVSVRGLMGYV